MANRLFFVIHLLPFMVPMLLLLPIYAAATWLGAIGALGVGARVLVFLPNVDFKLPQGLAATSTRSVCLDWTPFGLCCV